MNSRIVFTGGGTAGHVTPNIALIEALQQEGWHIDYIGSEEGVEKNMINALSIPYHVVKSGKLRRYFSWRNFFDPLNILVGIGQAFRKLRRLSPDVVFSKGGFVAFPVVVGAWLNGIPVLAHESDMSPGLANRLCFPFVNKICVTFAAAKNHFKHQNKVEITGTPIRQQLFEGDRERGLARCGFKNDSPCILVIGGSQGSNSINVCLRLTLEKLYPHFQVIHLCGKNKVDSSLTARPGYCQLDYADKELADLFAVSDVVVSRAGANSLYEILALAKPHVLIPLSQKVSRGDQVQNARYFQQQGISAVIAEEALTPESLVAAVNEVYAHRDSIIVKIKALAIESATTRIISLIKEQAHVQTPSAV